MLLTSSGKCVEASPIPTSARIPLVYPRREHLYQPGLTLVAMGLKPASCVVSDTATWLPAGVEWMAERVVAVGAFGLGVLLYTLEALIGSRRTRGHSVD